MNPNQSQVHPSGMYNNQPQQPNNNPPSNYQPMPYQYPQQYLPPTPPVVGYPIYYNPQANPHSTMGNSPQQNYLSGSQQTQNAPPMRNQQRDVLSNMNDQYHQNLIQWPPPPPLPPPPPPPQPPRPYPNDQQYYHQYQSNQQPMYMTGSMPPPPPSPSNQQPPPPNYLQMRQQIYTPYRQQVSPHPSSSTLRTFPNQNLKNQKKQNQHQPQKIQNKGQNNQNQPKPKQSKSAKKQKKQGGNDSKKQSARDMSSIDRIPTSTIIDKQCHDWGWTLPPLPQRSLDGIKISNESNPISNESGNSNENDKQPNGGFTFSLKNFMDNQEEEEEMNNENNEDDILYNNDSDDSENNSDDSENNNNNDDDENENNSNSNSSTENDSDENADDQGDSNENSVTDITEKYRDMPIKRVLFLWDQLFDS